MNEVIVEFDRVDGDYGSYERITVYVDGLEIFETGSHDSAPEDNTVSRMRLIEGFSAVAAACGAEVSVDNLEDEE